MRILLVEDHLPLAESVAQALRGAGLTVDVLHDGVAAEHALASEDYALAVLDVGLPRLDGFEVLARVRGRGKTLPVLMLTARGEETDRIVGIEMGADDYLVKPFNPRELLARIKSILRRTRALPPNLRPEAARCLHFSGWCLDTAARLLTAPDGVAIPLSGGEYRLLRILLDHPNRVLTRDQLCELIHGREAGPFDRAIDVQVSRLRQRLRDDSREPQLVKTVRGEGYVLACTVEGRDACA